jgi:hypothetical protein
MRRLACWWTIEMVALWITGWIISASPLIHKIIAIDQKDQTPLRDLSAFLSEKKRNVGNPAQEITAKPYFSATSTMKSRQPKHTTGPQLNIMENSPG